VEQFVQSLGVWIYIAVFVLMWLENAGLPLPSQTVALIAAAFAGQGKLDIWAVALCTFAGGFLGYTTGYWLGLHGGRKLVERYGKFVFVTPKRFALAEKAFYKHGHKAIFFGRYLPFLCMWAGNLAGIARLNWHKFLAINLIGTFVWTIYQITLGYVFGRSWEMLAQATNNVGLTIALAVSLVGLFIIGKKLLKLKSRQPRRPQELPIKIKSDEF
jgi:membrane protein DedA with SNARE-associated domain